jgi:hypothetical protein
MGDNGTVKKVYDIRSLGIEETDFCPCCRRLLKGLVEENEGGFLRDQVGNWVCTNCGVTFMPKSVLRKLIQGMREKSLIIRPQFIPPPGVNRS